MPTKLRRHFETNDSEFTNKDDNFFESKLEPLEISKQCMSKIFFEE